MITLIFLKIGFFKVVGVFFFKQLSVYFLTVGKLLGNSEKKEMRDAEYLY